MDILLVKPNGSEEKSTFENLLKLEEKTILYFYPKDNTSGCSTQAIEFSEHLEEFRKKGIQIIWVSKDSVKSHVWFIEKKGIKFPLISDTELEIHNKYTTYCEKKMCGRTFMGTVRSTFLLDNKWEIIKEWRNVRAKGHIEKLLKEI